MTMFFEHVMDFLGANKYSPVGNCLTNDYVLVNMFWALKTLIAAAGFSIAVLLWMCWRDSLKTMRLAIILIKDPWIIKLVSLYIGFMSINYFVSALTLTHSIFNFEALIIAISAGVSVWTTVRITGVIINISHHQSILDDLLTSYSGTIPDYGELPVEGVIPVVPKPLPIKSTSEARRSETAQSPKTDE